MEFRVLGPVEVYSGDKPVHVGGVKQRSILALLIANRGQTVTADRIVGEVYGEDAAAGARRSVQTIISMLRREFGDAIVGTGDGYRFDAPRSSVDAYRFEDGVAEGLGLVGDDPRRASSVFDEALGMWQGDPYGDVDGRGAFEPEVARLTELRFAALEARAEADLACGRHREVVAELEALVGEYPLRERLWGWLMVALYRTGRQADALVAYQRARAVFGELGLEPSTELRELEGQVLLRDESLDLVPMVPHNLPTSLTSFVGRKLELIELGERLSESRLVTLTGPGGSGKTRLAIEAGREVLDGYPDGVWFVDFRGAEESRVTLGIASTLGVVVSGEVPVADQLVGALASRGLLLVLDNCEHVLDAVAPFVERLATSDGRAGVLATSREPLGVSGESVMPVDPLPLPESAGIEDLAGADAVVLFAERATGAQPGFALEEHVEAVFRACRAVDGLPLALELAAARLAVFSPEELAIRLDDQLAMLKTTRRAGDLRHGSIETTIAWSWELLDATERVLLSRLSIFLGAWTMEAAEAVCGFGRVRRGDVADVLGNLVAKSLVTVAGPSAGSTRYRLLEPIRQYAERILDEQAAVQLQGRCIDYWSGMLTGSYGSESRFVWRNHEETRALEVDQEDLTAAVEWALQHCRFEDAMTIFASPFGDLLLLRGSGAEMALRWLAAAIVQRDAIQPGVLLSALEVGGNIADSIGRFDATLEYAELGIDTSRDPEERRWYELAAALATNRLEGHSKETNAVFSRIAADAEEPGLRASAFLAEALNNRPKRAWVLTQQAMESLLPDAPCIWDECRTSFRIFDVAEDSGHYEAATEAAERALELSRRHGWRRYEALTGGRLACLYATRGRVDEAVALVDEAVAADRRILGDAAWDILEWAACVYRLNGDLESAQRYIDEGTENLIQAWSGQPQIPSNLGFGITLAVEAALVARDEGDLDRAVVLLDGASERLEKVGHTDFVWWHRWAVHSARATIALRRVDPRQALQYLAPLLSQRETQHTHLEDLEAIDLTAIALAQQGQAEQAARLAGAVDHERERTGLAIRPPDIRIRESAMHDAQTALGDRWDTIVGEGRTMNLDEALAYARAGADTAHQARSGTNHADGDPVVRS